MSTAPRDSEPRVSNSTRPAPPSWMVALALFCFSAVVFLAVAGDRLKNTTPDNHFSYLADSYLHGTPEVRCLPDDPRGVCPPGYGGNDWARYEGKWYVTFPSFPAVLYMPLVKIYGRDFHNVRLDAVIAASAPALLFLLLERLARREHRRSQGTRGRSWRENLAFAFLLPFGTVYFFTAVQGSVWFTAHVVSVPLTIGYLWFALGIDEPLGIATLEFLWFLRPLGFIPPVRRFLERPQPVLASFMAGFFMLLLFHTRASFIYATPFFALEALRASRTEATENTTPPPDVPPTSGVQRLFHSLRGLLQSARTFAASIQWMALLTRLIAFAIPVAIALWISFRLNKVRFGDSFEVGYRYLQIGWRDRIEHWGLFNYHYLSRNLAVFLASLPWVTRTFPYVLISRHGIAIWLTTPHYLEVLRLRRGPGDSFFSLLVLTTATLALTDLLYQNSGWVQFGFRFSNDFAVFLIVLLALNGKKIGRLWAFAMVIAVAVNLFGALTFDRAVKWRGQETSFYDNDTSQQRYFHPD